MKNVIYGLKRATTRISNNAAKRLIPLGLYDFLGLELSNSGDHDIVAEVVGGLHGVTSIDDPTTPSSSNATPGRSKCDAFNGDVVQQVRV
jgi:hypothetical protein